MTGRSKKSGMKKRKSDDGCTCTVFFNHKNTQMKIDRQEIDIP